jgi:hypothetical protein
MTSEEAILNEMKHLRSDASKIDRCMEGMETARVWWFW